MKTLTKLGWMVAALAFLAGVAFQKPAIAMELPMLTLKPMVQVTADEVTLRDLVVGDGSSFENIVVCHSPLLGSVRTLSKVEIAALLRKNDDDHLLSGPEQVNVTRAARKISAEDLRPLIEAELKTRNSKAAITGIQLQVAIFVTDVDGLKLRKLRFDSSINRYRAWFVASDAPHAVIFEAMATLDRVSYKNILPGAKSLSSALPVSVHRGKTAMMQLEGEGFSATLMATCLEDGRVGETIQVREQASKHKYRAEVLAPGQVRAISREN